MPASSRAESLRRRCGRRCRSRERSNEPGVAVEQRGAVEVERRRQRAQQEVLQRRLLGQQPAPPGQPAQQVERQRQDLQRDEHGDQVGRGREEHHARQREQRQREDLGVLDAARTASRFGARCRARPHACGGEDAAPRSRCALGEDQDARSPPKISRIDPHEVGRPVDGYRAHRRSARRAADASCASVMNSATAMAAKVMTSCADRRARGARRPRPARPRQAAREDQDEAAPAARTRWSASSDLHQAHPPPSARRPAVADRCTPTCCMVAATDGSMIVEHRLREDAEQQDQQHQRGQGEPLPAVQVVGDRSARRRG